MDLKKRIEKFKESEYESNKEFYIKLKEGQKPHTLFIACSDSRVSAETLLQAKAGEIFHIRNVANIVPREDEINTRASVISAIEYAVKILKVKNIIVCGHSNCGGCAAIRNPKEKKEMLPYTWEWISKIISISDYINKKYPEMKEEDKIVMLEKLNAVQQLDNLMTYDFVKQMYESGNLNLQAYYYEIDTGNISVYDYNNIFSGAIKEITSDIKLHIDRED